MRTRYADALVRLVPSCLAIGCLLFAPVARAQETQPLPAPPITAQSQETTVTVKTSPVGVTPQGSNANTHGEGTIPVDQPSIAATRDKPSPDQKFLSGFRLGYMYVANSTKRLESLEGASLKDRVGMRSPHQFLIGYEAMYRMTGHSWLNVILVGNVMVAGLEQSKVFPSGNALLGFEFNNSFQLGVGANLTPLKGSEAHAIIAAGWTPTVGAFYVPVHFFFVPDVDEAHRMGVTTGVTF